MTSSRAASRRVLLLRAIDVGGRNLVPMGALREVMAELRCTDVRTLLHSGNAVFAGGARTEAAFEKRIEAAVAKRFGCAVDCMVRSAAAWGAILAGNPFPEDARRDPARLVVYVPKQPVQARSLTALRAALRGPERVERAAGVLFVVYPEGIGHSKLTAVVIERAVGCSVTGRNWNTAIKLGALLG